jgi:HPt (histidine-containing phosphotransfer) domain-containing protein
MGTASSTSSMPASENALRQSLAAWLRWHAPSAEERNRAPESCHPLLDAMARASGVQAVARLATEIENADERLVALAADYEAEHDKLRAEVERLRLALTEIADWCLANEWLHGLSLARAALGTPEHRPEAPLGLLLDELEGE